MGRRPLRSVQRRRTGRSRPRPPPRPTARASASGSGRPACNTRRCRRGSTRAPSPTRFTSSASTSGSKLAQDRVVLRQRLPGLRRHQRFGRPRRARVEGDDPPRRRAVQEEGQVDRQLQALPRLVGQAEVGQVPDAPGHAPVLRRALAAEQDGAGVAGAGQPPGGQLDQVGVLGPPARRRTARSARAAARGRTKRRSEASAVRRGVVVARFGIIMASLPVSRPAACAASAGRSGRGPSGLMLVASRAVRPVSGSSRPGSRPSLPDAFLALRRARRVGGQLGSSSRAWLMIGCSFRMMFDGSHDTEQDDQRPAVRRRQRGRRPVPSTSTAVTSGAWPRIASSIVCFMVTADDGQPWQLPSSRSRTTPSRDAEQLDVAAVRARGRAAPVPGPGARAPPGPAGAGRGAGAGRPTTSSRAQASRIGGAGLARPRPGARGCAPARPRAGRGRPARSRGCGPAPRGRRTRSTSWSRASRRWSRAWNSRASRVSVIDASLATRVAGGRLLLHRRTSARAARRAACRRPGTCGRRRAGTGRSCGRPA